MFSDRQAAGMNLDAISDVFASALIQPLLQTPILRILSDLQRNLDPLDIEGLSKLWKQVESTIAMRTLEGSELVPPYILDNRRIMSLSNFLQFIPLQGVWPPRTSFRFP